MATTNTTRTATKRPAPAKKAAKASERLNVTSIEEEPAQAEAPAPDTRMVVGVTRTEADTWVVTAGGERFSVTVYKNENKAWAAASAVYAGDPKKYVLGIRDARTGETVNVPADVHAKVRATEGDYFDRTSAAIAAAKRTTGKGKAVAPKPAKPAKAAKAPKVSTPDAKAANPAEHGGRAPTGNGAVLMALCVRPGGATRDELMNATDAATPIIQARNTGVRWGYEWSVVKGEGDRPTRYVLKAKK